MDTTSPILTDAELKQMKISLYFNTSTTEMYEDTQNHWKAKGWTPPVNVNEDFFRTIVSKAVNTRFDTTAYPEPWAKTYNKLEAEKKNAFDKYEIK